MSFSCAFAGWTRWLCWCIAMFFRFLASKALRYTPYHAEDFGFFLFFFAILAMDVDPFDTYPAGATQGDPYSG